MPAADDVIEPKELDLSDREAAAALPALAAPALLSSSTLLHRINWTKRDNTHRDLAPSTKILFPIAPF